MEAALTPLAAALRAATLPDYSIGIRLLAAVGVLILALAVVEQVFYTWRRLYYNFSGPIFIVPFIGAVVSMVYDPYAFWERQRAFAPAGASCNTIGGIFMVFLTDMEAAQKVMCENGPDKFIMVLHPSGERILGPNNIAFQTGATHKALRQSFLPLFSRKALSMYYHIQTGIINSYIDTWLSKGGSGGHFEVRDQLVTLNRKTSQTVFAGPYIDDHDLFSRWYKEMTDGFLTMPIYFPGTGLWNAVEARKKVVQCLAVAAQKSKAAMAKGVEPRCLLDFWVKHVLEIVKEAQAAGVEPPRFTHDFEMGETIMDFLFAAQDASSSSLVWCVHFMSEYPEVLARVREEQARLRPNAEPLTFELMENMTYARAVVKEVLRIRVPPPMVPNLAKSDMQLTPEISVPKGALVIPSTWNLCLQGFPDAHTFNPDRMLPENAEDIKYRKYYVPFGAGPHLCVGREYAMNHLQAFLITLAMRCDWDRFRDGVNEHKIIYLPSLYPGHCMVRMRPRGEPVSWYEEQARAAASVSKPATTHKSSSASSSSSSGGSFSAWQKRWPSAESR